MPDADPATHIGSAVEIDVGLHSLLALSNGQLIDNPRWLRAALAKLRVAQRRMAQCKRFGSGWRKAAYQVAKLQEQVANQRPLAQDHDCTSSHYRLLAIEALNLAFMTRNGYLSLSAHDAALGLCSTPTTSASRLAGQARLDEAIVGSRA